MPGHPDVEGVWQGPYVAPRRQLGRTMPRISIEPAPATVTFRPGRGAWTIFPSPMYMPMWLASW